MISKNKLIAIIVVVIIIVVGVVSFNNNQQSSPDSLKLGLMLPLTGDYGAAGQNMQKGMQIAIDEYRKNNPGTEIDVVIEDDAYNVTKGLSAYKKLTGIDNVDVETSTSLEDMSKIELP